MAEKRGFTDVLLQWLFQLASDPRVWGICALVTSCRNCRQTDEVRGLFHPPSRELKEEHLRKVKSCGTFRYNQAVVFSFSIKAWLIFISVSSEVVETRVIKPNSIHDVKAKKLMGYYYIMEEPSPPPPPPPTPSRFAVYRLSPPCFYLSEGDRFTQISHCIPTNHLA